MLNRRATPSRLVEQGRHVERTDQDLRDDDERRLTPGPPFDQCSDEPRHEEHSDASGEAVAPGLAPVLPLEDADLRPERRQDAAPRHAFELDQDRRERRQCRARAPSHAPRPPSPEADLIECSLAEAPEPAVKRARVERSKLGGDLAQAAATTQVARYRPLDERQGIELPRPQIRWQDARPMPALPAPRERGAVPLDRPRVVMLEEHRRPSHSHLGEREPPYPIA